MKCLSNRILHDRLVRGNRIAGRNVATSNRNQLLAARASSHLAKAGRWLSSIRYAGLNRTMFRPDV
jgi:hypothetical protein